ncbi:hypothetical protein [Marispirochaeta sp.]|uniref:hypothetical protein n=1 Tax=Marispirochaeta sp. TaxID=2038653 RepID=UPI0029C70CC4|nr:hypothetical protein [Marispirochaeta sp.]
MDIPAGILLNLQLFPPKGEIMRDLLYSIRDREISTVYLDPDRHFCWSFDPALKDPAAYPEEFFRGLLSIGESLNITFIPVLSSLRVNEFIQAHPGTGASVLPEKGPPQNSIIQHLVEDMLSDLLSVFAVSPCVAITACDETSREGLQGPVILTPEIVEGVSRALELDLTIIAAEKCTFLDAEKIGPHVSGIFAPGAEGFQDYTLPSPPSWLELLPESLNGIVQPFIDMYSQTDELFNAAWLLLRQRWEGRLKNLNPLIDTLQEIASTAPRLKEQGERLFHSDWFDEEQRRWHCALYEASVHQFASQPESVEYLCSIHSLLDPVGGARRYQ